MRSTPSPTPPSPNMLYLLFGVTGIATVLLGVLLPQIAALSHLGDAEAGRLLALQFGGQLSGALLVGRRTRLALIAGVILTILAAAGLVVMTALRGELLFVYGLGLGIVMTATNILVGTETGGALRASRLELLNTFWPLGAAIGPWVAVVFRSDKRPTLPYAALAAAFTLMLVPLLLRGQRVATVEKRSVVDRKSNSGSLLLYCVLGLLAIGVESSVAGWLTTFGARYLRTGRAVSWLPTLFWCGLLLGRFTASRAVLSVRTRVFGAISATVAISMIVLLAVSHGAAVMCIAAFGCAFAVGPLYPMVLARSVEYRWKNLVFFSAGIGSALVPWTVGRASLWSGSLREAMAVPAGAALLLLLALQLDRGSDHPSAGHHAASAG